MFSKLQHQQLISSVIHFLKLIEQREVVAENCTYRKKNQTHEMKKKNEISFFFLRTINRGKKTKDALTTISQNKIGKTNDTIWDGKNMYEIVGKINREPKKFELKFFSFQICAKIYFYVFVRRFRLIDVRVYMYICLQLNGEISKKKKQIRIFDFIFRSYFTYTMSCFSYEKNGGEIHKAK